MAIDIEVAYALPDKQTIIALTVGEKTTVLEAIEQSGIQQEFPNCEIKEGFVGIWSKPVKMDAALKSGDRIEIYRELTADPTANRRQKAKEA